MEHPLAIAIGLIALAGICGGGWLCWRGWRTWKQFKFDQEHKRTQSIIKSYKKNIKFIRSAQAVTSQKLAVDQALEATLYHRQVCAECRQLYETIPPTNP